MNHNLEVIKQYNKDILAFGIAPDKKAEITNKLNSKIMEHYYMIKEKFPAFGTDCSVQLEQLQDLIMTWRTQPSNFYELKADINSRIANSTWKQIPLIQGHSKTLYLMRGITATGKSYHSDEMIDKELGGGASVIYSSDEYFNHLMIPTIYFQDDESEVKITIKQFEDKATGKVYRWSPTPNQKENIKRTEKAMIRNIQSIIIDNTNCVLGHMKPYVFLAMKYGYNVTVIESEFDDRCDIYTSNLLRSKMEGKDIPIGTVQFFETSIRNFPVSLEAIQNAPVAPTFQEPITFEGVNASNFQEAVDSYTM